MKAEAEIQEGIESHEARNVALLRRFIELRADLHQLRYTDHHFWAYSRRSADSLADALRRRGYVGPTIRKVDTEDGSEVWSIEAAFTRSLIEAASRSVSDELVRLAAEFDAEYDGWGASV